jgi:hypothetical protein
MLQRARSLGVLLGLLCVIGVCASDGAAACGRGSGRSYVVAHGQSPNNVPWQFAARPHERWLAFHFAMGPPAYKRRAGYNFSMAGQPGLTFSVGTSTNIDPFAEDDLVGMTNARVAKLVVDMSDDTTLEVAPQVPPQRLRHKLCWLRGLRFFGAFFTSGKPQVLTALDADGQVLAQQRSEDGTFDAPRLAWR